MIKDIRTTNGIGQEKLVSNYIMKFQRLMPKDTADFIVKAEINHSRWICKCPWCNGAEIADKQDKRFFCLSCFNESIGGKWAKVEFPKDAEEIEVILSERPMEENRNWMHGESLAKLRQENKERKVV